MRSLDFGRCALTSWVAAMLTGCGALQSPIGAPGAMPQTFALATHAARGKSWMLPEAKSDDHLLIFSYPKGKLVGEITVPSGDFAGLCSDSAGDVFVTSVGSRSQSNILEYAHGGTEPIGTLDDPGWPNGCAVDPTTGSVAVTNQFADDPPYYRGDVVIFPNGQAPPAQYFDSNVGYFLFCAYDATGNLFADGDGYLTELAAGAQSLSDITLSQSIGPSSIQWVSAYQAFGVGG